MTGRRRLVTAVAAALVVLGACTALRARPASAASAGGVSLRPGQVDEADPVTRSYFKLLLAPGTTQRATVVVANNADVPANLVVSSVDGLTGVTSGAVYANRQDAVRRTGAWVTVDRAAIVVPPRAETEVGFTVVVPRDARPGDHLAGIAFEHADPVTSPGAFAITEIIRSVIGVQVVVPGEAAFKMRVDEVAITPEPSAGAAGVTVTLTNEGQRLGKPPLSVEVTGPNGYRRVIERELDTVLPGDTIPYVIGWPDALAPGAYTVQARLGAATDAVVLRRQVSVDTGLAAPRLGDGVAAAAVAPKVSPSGATGDVSATPVLLTLALGSLTFFVLSGRVRGAQRRRAGGSQAGRTRRL